MSTLPIIRAVWKPYWIDALFAPDVQEKSHRSTEVVCLLLKIRLAWIKVNGIYFDFIAVNF